MAEDLPQQLARTKRFRAGAASAFAVVDNGRFVTFLRDEALWVYDTTDRRERRVTAAAAYRGGAGALLSVLRQGELSVVDLAAERGEGFWWAPDGQRLLVARVDESPVQLRYLADPCSPRRRRRRSATRSPAPPTRTSACTSSTWPANDVRCGGTGSGSSTSSRSSGRPATR
ncbi:dipeptidyl peptidase IV (DPP IV)-like protein [Kribbella sp. VKM Ac-2568]|nr:DPP IV N-terminal domain-containing protein [Kribbella sp. VKM Ac-2568]TCM38623.1 dipeptidyl peptidase IV (DPP IV)-like protein [Kribbella sp. VKM Ac-2568]